MPLRGRSDRSCGPQGRGPVSATPRYGSGDLTGWAVENRPGGHSGEANEAKELPAVALRSLPSPSRPRLRVVSEGYGATRGLTAEIEEGGRILVPEPARRSCQEIERAGERVAHSYESLTYAAKWIASHEKQDQDWNAHIESFLVHARKLMQFLDPHSAPWPDDVVIADFLGDERTYSVDVGRDVRDQINKRLAHLTHAAVLGDGPNTEWPLSDMLDAITTAMEAFVGDLRGTSHAALIDRLERAAGQVPHFRKPTAPNRGRAP